MAEKIKGITIPIGADTTEFNKGLRQMNTSINTTGRQVKALEESLKIEWDPTKFEQAQKLAQKAITDTDVKVKALKDQLKYMNETGVDTNSVGYQRLQTQLLQTETSALKLKKQLDAINKIKVDNLVKNFKSVGDSITKAGKALIPFSAAAAGLLTGMGKIASETVKTASELNSMSQSVNMNAESLQKWRYIANQLGSDNASLQNALTKTQTAFVNLSTGTTSSAAEALSILGFSAEDAAKGMDANFELMIRKLESVQDEATKAYLVNELFGDQLGSKLIPLLNGGSDGLDKLTAEFQELGYITNDQVSSLSTLSDEINKMKTSFNSMKNDLAVALLPVMQSLVETVENKFLPAFRTMTEWFTNMSEKGRQTTITILAIVAALAPTIMIIGKLTSGIGSLLGTLSKLPALLSTLAAHPVVAIIGVIAALIMVLYSSNEQFRESIQNLVGTLTGALAPILEVIMELFGRVIEVIMPIINMLGDILTPIIDVLAGAFEVVGGVLQAILMPAFAAMQPMLEMMIQLITPVIDLLMKGLVPALEFVASIYQKVFGFIHEIMNKFLKGLENTFNKAIGLINKLIKGINKLGGWLGISLKELDKVSLTVESKNDQSKYESSQPPSINTSPVDNALNKQNSLPPITTVINNNQDNSKKNVTIGPGAIVIQNYAEQADVDGMAEKIMVLLAEGM